MAHLHIFQEFKILKLKDIMHQQTFYLQSNT